MVWFHNGVLLADDDPYDNISDHAAEFDLTAQLDEEMQSPIERMRRDRSNFKNCRQPSCWVMT